jgi:hypothetical protein
MNSSKMNLLLVLISFIFCLRGIAQVVPNVSIDSLSKRMFPIYFEALKSGIYDLPRDTAWKKLKTYDSAPISFEVPENWLNLGGLGSFVEVAFDASVYIFLTHLMIDR